MAETVFTTLKNEHKEIKRLMKQAEKDPGQFSSFTKELNSHVHAEEQVVYMQLKEEKSVHELIMEGFEEHHVVDMIVKEMEQAGPGSEQWQAKFKVMSENLEHHIEEEEQQMFPKAEKAVGRGRAMEMAEEYESAESALVGSAGRR